MTAVDPMDVWRTPPSWPEPKGPRPDEDLVWHYTNRAGLEGIVTSHTIWATSIDSLNDTGEGDFGWGDVWAYWVSMRARLIPEAPSAEEEARLRDMDAWVHEMEAWLHAAEARFKEQQVYVLCGCRTPDNLVHWRSYVGDDQAHGYAIAFQPDGEFRALNISGAPPLYQPDFTPAMYWRDVTYGSHLDFDNLEQYWDSYKRMFDRSLGALDPRRGGAPNPDGLRDEMDRLLFTALLATKHGAYRSEEEARVLVFGAPRLAWEREGRYGAQKCVTLTGAGDDHSGDLYAVPEVAPLPIAEVMVGPWNGPWDVTEVSSLLRDHGYDVPVKRSSIPIR